ncbi:MAG TPA: SDR family NAD(P)-dependent oxidoreductase [Xanthobacteraceae bacterium]|nr:SDR family NAD(P)-dependent oxidoreductase [Xanthobacteraceae bacterium]
MTRSAPFAGRVALVTGASRGIGRAIALALAEAGADVAVNYREQAEAARAVAEAVVAKGGRALAVAADVSNAADVARLIQAVTAALGSIDILINNAGIAIRRGIEDLSEDEFDLTLRVNLKSAFLCTQAVLPAMRARKWGRIVNISSGAARGTGSIGVHYNASKAGLEGLTRGYASRLAAEGITVNAVAPSQIETDMVPGAQFGHARHIPLGRLGRAEEVADLVVAVAANAYMTGQTVQLNGGAHFI